MNYLVIFLIVVLGIIKISNKSEDFIHIAQLKMYNSSNYKMWFKENGNLLNSEKFKKLEEEFVNPLLMTARAKRLKKCNLIINLLLVGIFTIVYLVSANPKVNNIYAYMSILLLLIILYSFQEDMIFYSLNIMKPIEDNINMGFYRQAQAKIENMAELKIVGITGSFGKTSTKFILADILKDKYRVVNTPESHNTSMGLSKVINNDLKDGDEVFIAEMGSRNMGEIKNLMKLTRPEIGIITSIGPAHLETFKNLDNIMKAKYEMVEELPINGVAVFNYDNPHIKRISDKTFKEKMNYGLEYSEKLDIYAEEIELSKRGTSFILRDKEGRSYKCHTKLLGSHNISNILAAVCVAIIMGFTLEEISEGIGNIRPIPHRLNLSKNSSGLVIIDDTLNSNPIGARAALNIISKLKDGKKIIVTPGMMNLGKMQELANRELGNNIAKVCDYVILVGKKRTKSLYKGILEEDYNIDNIYIVENIKEANKIIDKIAEKDDIVLYESYLPMGQ